LTCPPPPVGQFPFCPLHVPHGFAHGTLSIAVWGCGCFWPSPLLAVGIIFSTLAPILFLLFLFETGLFLSMWTPGVSPPTRFETHFWKLDPLRFPTPSSNAPHTSRFFPLCQTNTLHWLFFPFLQLSSLFWEHFLFFYKSLAPPPFFPRFC